MHLDDLCSEGLDGGQDQLLMLQGGDAEAQNVSEDKQRSALELHKDSEPHLSHSITLPPPCFTLPLPLHSSVVLEVLGAHRLRGLQLMYRIFSGAKVRPNIKILVSNVKIHLQFSFCFMK